MKTLHSLLVLALAVPAFSANLAISTYLRDGFIPSAIASDPQGNVYLAGIAVTDTIALAAGAAVIKVNANATQYVYFAQLDSVASDQITAIAVDGAGNAYVTGYTTNPNFPVFGSAFSGNAPSGPNDTRSFLIKLNAQGGTIFSLLLGGSTASTARAIALTSQGQILVSGMASGSGFPVTSGAYSVPDSTNQWFLTELDPGATRMVFSATGIGGSSLAQDVAGNIYMAGSSTGTTYSTTPGAYQTTFVQGSYCFGFCRFGFPGGLQHVTKTDASASRLIYSTGLNDPNGGAGNTLNRGLAVDSSGNAYVTGTLLEASYPFTATESTNAASSYLTKLDAAGANVLFSIPVGGAGVQLDSTGAVYAGGAAISINTGLPGLPGPSTPIFVPSFFSALPAACKPNFTTSLSDPYVLKIDPATGKVLDGQWIDGAAPIATAITLAGGKVWITGPSPSPQVPHSPGVLVPSKVTNSLQEGVFLSAVDFAAPTVTPSIACVVDSANFSHTGVVAPLGLITILGSGLGPTKPALAPAGEFSLGGVSITFDGAPAKLLYASDSQINVAVPGQNVYVVAPPAKTVTVMQLTYGGGTVQRQFPLTQSNPSLFADLSTNQFSCPGASVSQSGFQPVAFNADGSVNSCANPAKAGSAISLLLNGAGGYGSTVVVPGNMVAYVGFNCPALVNNPVAINDYVLKVDLSIPTGLGACNQAFSGTSALSFTLSYGNVPVGPFVLPSGGLGADVTLALTTGQPMTMIVWVRP